MKWMRGLTQKVNAIISREGFLAGRRRGPILFSVVALIVLGTLAPIVAQELRHGVEFEEHEGKDLVRRRTQWFFHQRAFPLSFIPAGFREKALAERDRMMPERGTGTHAALLGHVPPPLPSPSTWTAIGPQPANSFFFGGVSSRITAMAVDSCDATNQTVYLGAADGGVWKTTNGGTSWSPLTDSQPSLSTGSLALASTGVCTATSVFYGTGEEDFSFDSIYGSGMLISSNAGSTWTPDNTFHTSAPQDNSEGGPFIGAISVEPGTPSVLLASVQGTGTVSFGIWRSTNGGLNWTFEFPNTFGDVPTDVKFDPNDATGQIAFAAMGDPFGEADLQAAGVCPSHPCNGIYKTTNGGVSWSRVTSLDNALGVATSLKYGRITIALGPSTPASTPAFTPIYVAIADGTQNSGPLLALEKSTNGGATFSNVSSVPPFCNSQCFYDMAIAVDPANASVVFAGGGAGAMGATGTTLGEPAPTLIRSTDGGATWQDISVDSASTLQLHVDHHTIAFSPNGAIVYVGNDGGVWSSTNAMNGAVTPSSVVWTNLNSPLQLTQFYPGMSAFPTSASPLIVYGGAQDNGTLASPPSSSLAWADELVCGDGGYTAVDTTTGSPYTLYAACTILNAPGVLNKNTQGGAPGTNGANWTSISTKIMEADNANFIPPLVLDAKTPAILYYGTYRLWQTKNAGSTWNAISGDLTFGGGVAANGPTITTVTVAPSDSNTVYVGTDDGNVEVTTNALKGGAPFSPGVERRGPRFFSPKLTPMQFRLFYAVLFAAIVLAAAGSARRNKRLAFGWASAALALFVIVAGCGSGGGNGTGGGGNATFTKISTGLPPRSVTKVAVDPTTGATAYVTFSGFSGFNGDLKGHVFKTTNTGGAWTDISGNLPNIPVNDILVDPANPTTLYVATDVGVFQTTNSGALWAPIGTGLPNSQVLSLTLQKSNRILIAGTHGRGAWQLQI